MGYHRAGFDVVGVDIKPQRHYPFPFILADALQYVAEHGREYDAIHASPPCQAYSSMRHRWGREYPDLVASVRLLLIDSRCPYVIENVSGAPLLDPIILCGLNFGLRVYRHRHFECSLFLPRLAHPAHHRWQGEKLTPQGRTVRGTDFVTVTGSGGSLPERESAMGIDWMDNRGLSQAIPPAYTQYIGQQLRWAMGTEQ